MAADHRGRAVDLELPEQEREGLFQIGADGGADRLRQRPALLLERADRPLPRLVVELLGRVVSLLFSLGVLIEPGVGALAEAGRQRGMIEHQALKIGGEMNLGRLDPGEVPSQLAQAALSVEQEKLRVGFSQRRGAFRPAALEAKTTCSSKPLRGPG